ncbi:NAD(P)/FAD-dependent oxidoreductase [Paracraurococcus ruber]|uniref:FAD-dependent oxidoreductase n=1 Tax=Paracraurococcus ruber TaxID=77675 RepID=A0ABS1D5F0_9PROT|nr:FAD-dependent oxidoreductase [Paracraurococcus ruber]MBK1661786.1 FAD-dependent oxidoreductase [Paracraurococcus ruber]TDG27688.1 FAD-binding oxidoreductase [Paracraurococcus ruber]
MAVTPASAPYDCAVIGAGVMGCSTALFLARGGMRVALLDRVAICREASGVNAGTLTMQMTRAALIPYALRAHAMWLRMAEWADGGHVLATACPGLSVAFTDHEAAMLEERASIRRQAGAPIELVGPDRAREIEPGLSDRVLLAGHCPIDGFATAHLTGRAFGPALRGAGVDLREATPVCGIAQVAGGFDLDTAMGPLRAARLVLAGGVWLEEMCAWLGIRLPIKVLVNQLVVTERLPPVMRTVLGVASGLLSLKQYANGSVLIGGGWQGVGDRARGGLAVRPENLLGNIRLAAFAVPALREARVTRAWLGLEAETADALPVIGPIPGVPDAWIIGSVHSGYTSGPYMGRLLAQAVLGQQPELALFPPDRLLDRIAGGPQGPDA